MIEKIGLSYNIRFKNNLKDTNKQPHTKPTLSPTSCKNSQPYYPLFTANKKRNPQVTPLEALEYCYTNSASNLVNEATEIAKQNNNPEVTHFHIWKATLNQIDKYIEDLDNNDEHYIDTTGDSIPSFLEAATSDNIFDNENIRAKLKKIIQEENVQLDNIILNIPKDFNVKNPKLSDKIVRDIWSQRDDADERVYDYHLVGGTLYSADEDVKKFINGFFNKINDMTMIDHTPLDERPKIKNYDAKAQNVWKNLALGTSMFVTFDHKKVNSNMFITSLIDNKPDNYNVVEFNTNIKEQYLYEKANELSKDKTQKHAIIMYPTNMIVNSSTPEQIEEGHVGYSATFQNWIKNLPPNIKLIMLEPKDSYFVNMQNPIIQRMFDNFGEISVPVLSTQQFVKAFKEEPLLMEDIKLPFTKNAIEKTVESAAQLDGIFPDKAIKLMKKMSSYYIDQKEITEKDVINYVKEAKELFKKNEDDSSINIIFDTGKRIKNIVGKDATKKEAAAIVKQIKSGHMGTKGTIIYSQDSYAGSGRRFVAKAIAGEAKVPYMEINAMDFGTKDVDIFGGNTLTPEASIKKMFSLVNTQAESNSNKSAVLFIENFEYFSIGELISEYQQKAMAQLLREMDVAERKGLNILVVGSVSDPNLIGEAAMKSFKFVDSIEVSSPAYNDKERAEIIKNTLKENKIKIAAKTPEESEEIIKSIAKTTEGFPFIYMKNIVKKAQSVAIERGHKAIEKADFTEAYLQITTGRPSINAINSHEKQIVASHECGHAVNLEVMNNIAQDYGKPWHKYGKVNFITLDPRGHYGGAMYLKDADNDEKSFENAFTSIVCLYGGHSCEKYFYDMDGSWGISSDLAAATDKANVMVELMGHGAKTGKQSLWHVNNVSDNMQETIEKDRDVILRNALTASDLITEVYADFNREFTQKYSHLVGTGNCLIDGDVFRDELADWKKHQSPKKQQEIKLLENIILEIINKTKKGELY